MLAYIVLCHVEKGMCIVMQEGPHVGMSDIICRLVLRVSDGSIRFSSISFSFVHELPRYSVIVDRVQTMFAMQLFCYRGGSPLCIALKSTVVAFL